MSKPRIAPGQLSGNDVKELQRSFGEDVASEAMLKLAAQLPPPGNALAWCRTAAARIKRSAGSQTENRRRLVSEYTGLAERIAGEHGVPQRGLKLGHRAAPGGRKKSPIFKDAEELRAAVIGASIAELREWFGKNRPSDHEIKALCSDMQQAAAGRRRSWLAKELDQGIGDRFPWIADFRTRGLLRTKPAKQVGAPVPQLETNWRENALAIHQHVKSWLSIQAAGDQQLAALDGHRMTLTKDQDSLFMAVFPLADRFLKGAPVADLVALIEKCAGRPESVSRPPWGDWFLSDRELALFSLAVGNYPNVPERKLKGGLRVGQVVDLEIGSMQHARLRHGVLKTATEKKDAGVAPKPRAPRPGR